MQADFYLLPERASLLPFVCQLTHQLYEIKKTVYILTDSEQQAHALDELLWTFEHNSFIPHHLVGEGPKQPAPILIGHPDLPQARTEVLINLTTSIPSPLPFRQIIEIVTHDPAQKQTAREHYLAYKRLGALVQMRETLSLQNEPAN